MPSSKLVMLDSVGVLAAIELDDKPPIVSDKVHSVSEDRLLAAELHLFHLVRTQAAPEQ